MGIFSFLFGGKKKAKPEAKPAVVDKTAPTASVVITAPVAPSVGVTQAKLRLKLAAALRARDHAAAYDAAKGLADIQLRAGRRHVARGWQQQADRIKEGMAA